MSGFARDARGATAIEYAMIAGFVSIVIFAAVQNIGTSVTAFFNSLVPYI